MPQRANGVVNKNNLNETDTNLGVLIENGSPKIAPMVSSTDKNLIFIFISSLRQLFFTL